MNSSSKENNKLAITDFCYKVVEPLAHYLLISGMTYVEFDEIVKSLFIKVAAENFGISGRETNSSRISLLTGINRKQVGKIRSKNFDAFLQYENNFDVCTKVLTIWHTNEEFLDKHKKPLKLSLHGKTGSLECLYSKVKSDIPLGAVLYELKKSKAVRQLDDSIIAESRFFTSWSKNNDVHYSNAKQISDMISIFLSNLLNIDKPEYTLTALFSESVLTHDDYMEFLDIFRSKAKKQLKEIDDWLEQKRVPIETSDSKKVRAGMYVNIDGLNKPNL